jgi:hypothetical protein
LGSPTSATRATQTSARHSPATQLLRSVLATFFSAIICLSASAAGSWTGQLKARLNRLSLRVGTGGAVLWLSSCHRREAHAHLLHSASNLLHSAGLAALAQGRACALLLPPGQNGSAEQGAVGWALQCAEGRETQSLCLQPNICAAGSTRASLAGAARPRSRLKTSGKGVATVLHSIRG